MYVDLKIGAKRDGTLTALDARLVVNSGPVQRRPARQLDPLLRRVLPLPEPPHPRLHRRHQHPPAGRLPRARRPADDVLGRVDDGRACPRAWHGPDRATPQERRRRGRPDAERPPLAEDRAAGVPGEAARSPGLAATARPRPTRASASRSAGCSAASSRPAPTCRLENDGTLTVVVGSVDVSGTNTGLVLLAAEALGIAPTASASSTPTPTRRPSPATPAAARSP